MANYKLKNGHTLELSFNRGSITGVISEEKYQALIAENENFANEFEEVQAEQLPVKTKKDLSTKTEN